MLLDPIDYDFFISFISFYFILLILYFFCRIVLHRPLVPDSILQSSIRVKLLVPVSFGHVFFMELHADDGDDGRMFMAFSLIFVILAALSTQRLGKFYFAAVVSLISDTLRARSLLVLQEIVTREKLNYEALEQILAELNFIELVAELLA